MHLACTAPGCKKNLPPKAMWLAEVKALRAANGGQRVEIADFPKFVLCGRCGHLLRKEGVRVYRYLDTVERERQRESRSEAQAMAWKPFADRFKTAPKKASGRPKGRGRDGRNVGGGLARCAELDAKKRAKTDDGESQAS